MEWLSFLITIVSQTVPERHDWCLTSFFGGKSLTCFSIRWSHTYDSCPRNCFLRWKERQPYWKTDLMEDIHNKRWPQRKTTWNEENVNERWPKLKMTSIKDFLSGGQIWRLYLCNTNMSREILDRDKESVTHIVTHSDCINIVWMKI